MPKTIFSDHDPRLVSEFWTILIAKLGYKTSLFSLFNLQNDGVRKVLQIS